MNILHQNDCFSDWQSISSIFWFKIKHSFAMFVHVKIFSVYCL